LQIESTVNVPGDNMMCKVAKAATRLL